MRMTDKRKRIISSMQKGAVIMKTNNCATYTLSNGIELSADFVERMVENGALQKQEDGLMEGFGQTYRLAAHLQEM